MSSHSNGSGSCRDRGPRNIEDAVNPLFEPGGIFDFSGFGLDEDSQSSDDFKAERAQPISVADSPAVTDEIERLVAKADELVDRSRLILRDAPECRAAFIKGVFDTLQLSIAGLRSKDRSDAKVDDRPGSASSA